MAMPLAAICRPIRSHQKQPFVQIWRRGHLRTVCRYIRRPISLFMYRQCRNGGPMRVQEKKWGNSASVRIPASVMAAAAFKIDQPVEVYEEDGRVIIDPRMAPIYDLDTLLA